MLAVAVEARQATSPSTPQQAPPIIAGTTSVPIDVRVVDHNNKPVEGLTLKDFTVLDNGKPQDLSHFMPYAEAAPTPGAATTPELVSMGATGTFAPPQPGRTFLLMLGRGNLQAVSKGPQAAAGFVRTHLLPQDRVAVIAWNRASEFTVDHERIARLLDRFAAANAGIELQLFQWFNGLHGLFGDHEIPASVQKSIDSVFDDAGVPARTVLPGHITEADRMANDQREVWGALLGQSLSIVPGADAGGSSSGLQSPNVTAGQLAIKFADVMTVQLASYNVNATPATATSGQLEKFASRLTQTMQDVGALYAAVEALRRFEGEKHIVYFSEKGIALPRTSDDKNLAERAAAARVVIDTIQTGGTSDTTLDAFAVSSLETVAELSGGQSFQYSYADKALASIDQTTRAGYLLGYDLSASALDGRTHTLDVKVNRSGVTVLYRHSYVAAKEQTPLTRREVRAYGRITTAAAFRYEIPDLKMSAKADDFNEGGTRGISVALHVDPAGVSLASAGGQHTGSLDVAVFCDDNKDHELTDKLWRTVNLTLPDDAYQRFVQHGFDVTLRVPVDRVPVVVKVIAYDARGDLIGAVYARKH
jgi:VWFA-related protein